MVRARGDGRGGALGDHRHRRERPAGEPDALRHDTGGAAGSRPVDERCEKRSCARGDVLAEHLGLGGAGLESPDRGVDVLGASALGIGTLRLTG